MARPWLSAFGNRNALGTCQLFLHSNPTPFPSPLQHILRCPPARRALAFGGLAVSLSSFLLPAATFGSGVGREGVSQKCVRLEGAGGRVPVRLNTPLAEQITMKSTQRAWSTGMSLAVALLAISTARAVEPDKMIP